MYNKTEITKMPFYFDRYIYLVEESNLKNAFENSIQVLENLDIDFYRSLQGKKYAEGKWTVNEIFQHVADFERVFAFRTLLFARNFPESQNGIDENRLAMHSKANTRDIKEIIDDLIIARKSSWSLFSSFDAEDLQKTGINWESEMSVLAMGFLMVGHQNHHMKVIKELYWNL